MRNISHTLLESNLQLNSTNNIKAVLVEITMHWHVSIRWALQFVQKSFIWWKRSLQDTSDSCALTFHNVFVFSWISCMMKILKLSEVAMSRKYYPHFRWVLHIHSEVCPCFSACYNICKLTALLPYLDDSSLKTILGAVQATTVSRCHCSRFKR